MPVPVSPNICWPKSLLAKVDLPPLRAERQSLTAAERGRLPGIVVLPPQVARRDFTAHPISQARFAKPDFQAAPEAC
jgi:hypothetical protein